MFGTNRPNIRVFSRDINVFKHYSAQLKKVDFNWAQMTSLSTQGLSGSKDFGFINTLKLHMSLTLASMHRGWSFFILK